MSEIPQDLPPPIDDGAARHLPGMRLPHTPLSATSGQTVDIGGVPGRLVLYVYPMTGRPGVPLPDGWDSIPGARGCTPQACSFRDRYPALQALAVTVFGLSTQSSDYQREAKQRLQLPFDLLSDERLAMKAALCLPTFAAQGMELYKRLTLIALDGRIEKVFYPVFPPDRNVDEVLAWLESKS